MQPSQQIALGLAKYLVDNGLTLPSTSVASYYETVSSLALESEAQMKQDIFVLSILNFKQNGFYVEFGACDGVEYSNTLLLERNYGWTGIVSEPSKDYQQSLAANRNATIDNRCVWSESNQTKVFNETTALFLSTLDDFTSIDSFAKDRITKEKYNVETVSLNDLLSQNNAPFEIDYISIDTKGSEYNILNSFNFSNHKVKIFTINHDFTQDRESIYQLMKNNGYVRVANQISFMDDWYVLQEYIGTLTNTDNTSFTSTQPPTL